MSFSITWVSRASAKSSVTVASGAIIRSTEECEISRSCQSATFSMAGMAMPRTRRASPVTFSLRHRIALMGHGGRAFLPFRKKLFRLQHFRALQMPDLGRQSLHRRCDDGERRKEHCMAIARNDLRRGGLDGKAEFFRDMGFDARIDIRIGADGARKSRRSRFPRGRARDARGARTNSA